MAHLSYSLKPGNYRQAVLCKLIDLNKILDKFKTKPWKKENTDIHTHLKLQY